MRLKMLQNINFSPTGIVTNHYKADEIVDVADVGRAKNLLDAKLAIEVKMAADPTLAAKPVLAIKKV